MINFTNYIAEKWVADLPKGKEVFPIFENPSSKDLIDLQKNMHNSRIVRFIAVLDTKKIYVWDGMTFIHSTALTKLKSAKIVSNSLILENLDKAFCGECEMENGKLVFNEKNENDSYFGPLIRQAKMGRKDDAFLLAPYYDWQDLIDNLPNIIKKYNWVDKYIKGIDKNSGPAILLKYSSKK